MGRTFMEGRAQRRGSLSSVTGWRRDDAHGDDVLERLVDAHFQLHAIALAQHHEVAARRVGRGGHVDAEIVAHEVVGDVAAGRTRDEADGPDVGPRPLHEYGRAERVAAFREQRVGYLLDAG